MHKQLNPELAAAAAVQAAGPLALAANPMVSMATSMQPLAAAAAAAAAASNHGLHAAHKFPMMAGAAAAGQPLFDCPQSKPLTTKLKTGSSQAALLMGQQATATSVATASLLKKQNGTTSTVAGAGGGTNKYSPY